ncbi:patatin-like phospholipase family protein [Alkalihalobacillus sp. AL-G]|uniref:patatin-like phospholipase family protein n=1 Tax=Alkalihalobacillus sp. AL-G TaxID=2926399 RepID=UPI002729F252|nr:patatin-like phospholipase family protein [Alkalihalobacillus sp. AL-G]WLD95044.1 patatin-like phospholipase family protein [Alkalihalobacillus sp. AL-G]
MQPKVGLALGSGGARGFAHIGVIKALHQAGIPINMIAGSSMGALVGALYCIGHHPDTMVKMARLFRRKYYMDYTVPRMGFVSGQKVKQLMHALTHGKSIEELNIPLSIIATDLLKGEKAILQTGPVSDAIRASIAVPGIFVPHKIGDRLLIDGGVIDRVPVSVVKEMGADIVIAVDISHIKENPEINTIFDVILQSIDIMQRELVKVSEISSDVLIRPMVEKFSSSSFTQIDEIISLGEEETKLKLQDIKDALHNWRKQNGEK